MKKYIWILSILILVVSGLFVGQQFLVDRTSNHHGVNNEHGSLVVHTAYIFQPISAAKSAAGYLSLANNSGQDDVLVSASGKLANRIEIHTMAMDGEIMRMRQLPDGLSLPNGETTTLSLGGDHLMIMGLNAPLKAGEEVSLQLVFANAGSQEVKFKILKRGEMPEVDQANTSQMEHN